MKKEASDAPGATSAGRIWQSFRLIILIMTEDDHMKLQEMKQNIDSHDLINVVVMRKKRKKKTKHLRVPHHHNPSHSTQ